MEKLERKIVVDIGKERVYLKLEIDRGRKGIENVKLVGFIPTVAEELNLHDVLETL